MIAGNLFTRDYLLEGIVRTEQWAALSQQDLDALKGRLAALANAFLANANPNEAQTERDFIYPVLQVMGWAEMVQPVLAPKGRKLVPDALLLADPEAKARAAAEPEQWKSFQHGLAILEAKRWDHYLDRAGASGPHEGAPSTQMLQYLSRVDVQTGGKVRLGILTNGVKWRLYFQGALSVSEDFFEVDLARALQLPGHEPDLVDRADPRLTPGHALRLFILMFQKAAFLPVEGQSHPVAPSTTSRARPARPGRRRSRATSRAWSSTTCFPSSSPPSPTATPSAPPARPSPTWRRCARARWSCSIACCSWSTPRTATCSRTGTEPYRDFSLTTMRLDIAERKAQARAFSATAVTYWPRLVAIFKAISEGDNTFGIPPYNGGLFAKETAPLLERARLPDAIVANLVFGLSHREEDGRARYINYRDLSVQQLGSVYERTLEYGLTVADDGRVVVDADDTRRHQSGSYYTPDSLVMLIIEKTVGPLVEERLEAFRAEAEALAHDRRAKEQRCAYLPNSTQPSRSSSSRSATRPWARATSW